MISNHFGDDPETNTMMIINTFDNWSNITKAVIDNPFGDTTGTTTITTTNQFGNHSSTGLFQHTIYLVMIITMVIRQYTSFIPFSETLVTSIIATV